MVWIADIELVVNMLVTIEPPFGDYRFWNLSYSDQQKLDRYHISIDNSSDEWQDWTIALKSSGYGLDASSYRTFLTLIIDRSMNFKIFIFQ